MLQLMVGDSPFTHEHATLLNWFNFMINAAVKLYCFNVRGVYYFVHPIYINESRLENRTALCSMNQSSTAPQTKSSPTIIQPRQKHTESIIAVGDKSTGPMK